MIGEHLGALREDEGEHHHGQEDVHRRPGKQDLEALPLRLGEELVGLA